MKILAGVVALGLIAAAGAGAIWYLDPFGSDSDDDVDLDTLSAEFRGSACRQVAGIAAVLAVKEPTPSEIEFLRSFGRQVAGIRKPPRAFGDLARGGSNEIPGKGFLSRYDDGTIGQGRHFAGIVVASTFGGGAATRFVSIFGRQDPLESPDGQLTEEGIDFAQGVLAGDIELEESPEWIIENLCRRK